tara:strand:+ start:1650 stop:2318 length:669 start_codon:yes stop_codon:yes gene_type:complete
MIRILDICFSTLAIILLIPILLITSLMLLLTGEREVFFFQDRIGKDKKVFKLFKFVTMKKNSPDTGTITIKNDPRVLPIGRFLRKTKINELPQIFNILLGQMSFIGPRPLTQENFLKYDTKSQEIISSQVPGLSGIGSIIFNREEELLNNESDIKLFYDEIIVPYKAKLEKWFIKNRSIKIYFFLIFFTIFTLIFRDPSILFKIMPDLPKLPEKLHKKLNVL